MGCEELELVEAQARNSMYSGWVGVGGAVCDTESWDFPWSGMGPPSIIELNK